MEVRVTSESMTDRRRFLGGMFGTVAAAGLPIAAATGVAAAEPSDHDAWIKEVKGEHRCLFDFPRHNNGMPQLHILNYINTYNTAYKTTPGQVGAVGTFYSVGTQSSIPLAFNDSIWAKYQLGAYLNLKDAAGTPYTRNVFNQPTPKDLHLLLKAADLADAEPDRRRRAGDRDREPAEDGHQVPALRERARAVVHGARGAGQGQDC